ncbi:MAG TPA: elongation factor G [Ruminiclostridium sp.]|nr:elongation factor G [Clostridiaceae bacterium]HAA26046.1 elongation factor G [Ruminiclostridium sp.]
MKEYSVDKIRNVCLLGHGGAGKTTLAEALLFGAKAIDRFGSVVNGNTVMDYDPEEVKRQISTGTSLAPLEWKGCKINIIDTPGYFDFIGEQRQGLRVADGAIILVSAKDGVEVGTEKAWQEVVEQHIPKMFFVSKIDEEHADFFKVFDQLQQMFGKSVIAFELPIIESGSFAGIVDVATMKAKRFNGKDFIDAEIPDGMADMVEQYREGIIEAVAETNEDLMEKYFSGESFSDEEILSALKAGVKAGEIAPVLCGSAINQAGVKMLLDAIVDYIPSFSERGQVTAKNKSNDETVQLNVSNDEALSALVFKTIVDPFVGRVSYIKVMSGVLNSDSTVYNSKKDKNERIAQLFLVKGKQQINTDRLVVGDIGAVAKLMVTETNDTLCTKEKPVILPEIEFPQPMLSMAVVPKTKGDEEKISSGLTKLMDEDPTFKVELNTETKQTLIYGIGDQHLDLILSKLRTKFKVDVELSAPRIAYRETIRSSVKVQGKHKKQTGGHGQFADVWIEFEPGPTEDLVFEEKIFGGAVPKQYFPAVEKGLRESIQKGVLAGYPVVNLKATLYDGKYHPVDSSEMAFKIAANLAYREGLPKASPVLLEPISRVEVLVPENYMGDVIGDLNKRRGRILGMNPVGNGMQQVIAEVPDAEMYKYATDLRSITQGRGSYTMKFERYEEVPPNIAEKIIAEANKEEE